MKQPWDATRLTVHHWTGDHPVAGDGLVTSTGRLYMVQKVVYAVGTYGLPTRTIRALECIVMPKGESVPGDTFNWTWSPRKRKHHGGTLAKRLR